MAQNVFVLSFRYVFVDLIGGIVLFPFWWYSRGVLRMGRFLLRQVQDYAQMLGIGVWIKNIFVPMYGSRDFAGRVISFFVRVFQIIARTGVLMLIVLLCVVVFLLYLLAPIFVVYEIFYHYFGAIVT